MSPASRRIRLALLAAAAWVVASCGGSSSSASSSTSATACTNQPGLITSFPTTATTNAVPLVIDGGPIVGGAPVGSVNQSYVTITVCVPGTTNCQVIDHVWVDTGSYGLRLMPSVLTLSLPASPAATGGNVIGDCVQFVASYMWGAVRVADVKIGGETAPSLPLQVVGDPSVPATAPSGCSAGMPQITGVSGSNGLLANGLLGVGNFRQDCGPFCAPVTGSANPAFYYTCTSAGSCSPTTMPLNQQIQNPVGVFTSSDNNGVVMQIPSIPPQGQANVSGWLVFGIDTQTNNQLGSALVFLTDGSGFINTNTTYGSTTNTQSYIDSGSNGLFFNDPSLTACPASGSTPANGFFCATAMLSATMTAQANTPPMHTYGFCVQNFNTLSGAFNAFNDLAGPSSPNTFDWGLPFFYGRSVYTALEQTTIGGNSGPFVAASTP